jgi:murein DD-endopeptidase MepM/ murein hydrolase activator NlpD
MLIIPGGRREYISKVPTVPRKNPASASYLGPGSCSAVSGGAVGTNTWVRPVGGILTNPFSPETNHPAIDLAAPLGTGIAAADTGVVVYAGSTYPSIGYGNLVIIDHGNGWQTLYAHLGPVYVSCGQGIYQGAIIGAIGMTGNTTGPHLHFEMRSDTYGKVNPLNFIP